MITEITMSNPKFQVGDIIRYDDKRPDHSGIDATVLAVTDVSMVVQFVDRADTTLINYSEKAWMDHISVVGTKAHFDGELARHVLAKFAALRAIHEAGFEGDRGDWESMDIHQLTAEALENAKELGWDFETVNNGDYAMWCLKATAEEIGQANFEGFKKFAEAKIHEHNLNNQ